MYDTEGSNFEAKDWVERHDDHVGACELAEINASSVSNATMALSQLRTTFHISREIDAEKVACERM